MTELRELTADWTNPDYDGRVKHGPRSIKKLPKGSRILVDYDTVSLPGAGQVRFPTSFTKIDGTRVGDRRGQAEAVIAVSTPVEGNTWREFCATRGTGQGLNAVILETLWQQGPVMQDLLRWVYDEALKKSGDSDL